MKPALDLRQANDANLPAGVGPNGASGGAGAAGLGSRPSGATKLDYLLALVRRRNRRLRWAIVSNP